MHYLRAGDGVHVDFRVARSKRKDDVLGMGVGSIAIHLTFSLPFLACFVQVLPAMSLAVVAPVQAVYGRFRTDRVLALEPACGGVMDSQPLGTEALDDGGE